MSLGSVSNNVSLFSSFDYNGAYMFKGKSASTNLLENINDRSLNLGNYKFFNY